MIYVLLAAVCSVLVSVLLKLAKRHGVDVPQAVAWNYVVAALLAAWLLAPSLAPLRTPATPWPALVALALLLPTIFVALGASVRHAGIVRSDAAQRLSLLLSLIAAFVLFGERLDGWKLAGCGLGLAALIGMVWRHGHPRSDGRAAWVWPLTVFVGFAAIDVLFKRVAAAGVPLGSALLAMFTLALPVAFALAAWHSRGRFNRRSALGGAALGACNFGNILYYLKAHRALPEHPALVFASMNLGVVMLGALAGVLVFRERLSRLNLAGVALALVAIGLLTRG
ncbi:MAG: DMT family transporter [Rhodanobacter sp.]|nr:MAG: DMT family transporter [Rhodanobacter sp.]TAM08937.1 MAG: DMT family transporter [Rhodanobacter sp.]TAM35955.1 MAG: DMT family transporter [Rhodanobacter sp.]